VSWIEWLLWAVAIGCNILVVIFLFIVITNAKEEERVQRQAFLKSNKQQERAEKKERDAKEALKIAEEQEEWMLNLIHEEKLKTISLLQQKNQKISQEIESLRYIVSGLSIFDDDFLEQQPKILEYINEVIDEGRA